MKHNPANPHWFDRDRFVLSRRARLDAPLLDPPPERVRRLDGRPQELPPARRPPPATPSTRPRAPRASRSPRARWARAWPTRWASRWPSACWPRASTASGHEIVDHCTYAIACDGDMQEGVASEASSLAGHLGLGRLTVFYDDNHIQLAGDTSMGFSEDVGARYEAYGWHVQNLGEDTRARQARRGDREGARGRGPALAGHPAHPHRLRLAEQAGHPEGARLAAGRGRGAAHQGGLRLGPRRPVPRARRGARALRERSSSAARRPRTSGRSGSSATATSTPRRPRRSSGDRGPAARAAGTPTCPASGPTTSRSPPARPPSR